MSSLQILLVEPPQAVAAELTAVAAALARRGVSLHRVTHLSDAIAYLTSDEGPTPAVVLLSEARPGLWTERDVHALRTAVPLVRVLRVSGSWCDGQARSGRPPAGSTGITWHQAASRLPRELEAISRGGVLAAPLTATSEDLWLARRRQAAGRGKRERIAIHAPRAAQAEAWAALCRGLGYRPEIVSGRAKSGEGLVKAVLWDCDPRDLADAPRVREFVEWAEPAPVVAVCGFPRPDDVASAHRQGVAAVLGKPLLAADLEWLFSRLFEARGAE